MKVTCATCGSESEIAEPTPESFSAHPDHDRPVVLWKCPAADCGATNVIEQEG